MRPFGARARWGEFTKASYSNVVPHFCSPIKATNRRLCSTASGASASSDTRQAGPVTLSVATFFSTRFALFVSRSEHQANSVAQNEARLARVAQCNQDKAAIEENGGKLPASVKPATDNANAPATCVGGPTYQLSGFGDPSLPSIYN